MENVEQTKLPTLASPCLMISHCYWKIAASKNFGKVHRRGNSVKKFRRYCVDWQGKEGRNDVFLVYFSICASWVLMPFGPKCIEGSVAAFAARNQAEHVLLCCIRRGCISSLTVRKMVFLAFFLFLVLYFYSSSVPYNDDESQRPPRLILVMLPWYAVAL